MVVCRTSVGGCSFTQVISSLTFALLHLLPDASDELSGVITALFVNITIRGGRGNRTSAVVALQIQEDDALFVDSCHLIHRLWYAGREYQPILGIHIHKYKHTHIRIYPQGYASIYSPTQVKIQRVSEQRLSRYKQPIFMQLYSLVAQPRGVANPTSP